MRRVIKGFSLIELLVVIGIAGVIIAVTSTSYTTAQRQARDSRRIQDMKMVQTAFEQFYATNNSYPNTAAGNINQAFQSNAPTDPKTGTYTWNTSATAYCICATLEGAVGNANPPTTTSCSWNSNGSVYCVQNQQ